jgi:hypothetical protein
MTLDDLQRIKQWQLAHRETHPVEYHLWDATLIVWVTGWIGWLPAYALDAPWATPLCLFGMWAPDLYVRWRGRSHRLQRVRCDWLPAAGLLPRRPDVRR